MTYTFFLQRIVFGKNCKYFCNDVICIYEKFASKVGKAFPEYFSMTKNIKGFLPRMHAKAHLLPCQVKVSLYHDYEQKILAI